MRRHGGQHGAADDAVRLQLAQLRGQGALRHRRQQAADFVKTQHLIAQQMKKNRAFPFAADDRQRGLDRATLGAIKTEMRASAHEYPSSNYLK